MQPLAEILASEGALPGDDGLAAGEAKAATALASALCQARPRPALTRPAAPRQPLLSAAFALVSAAGLHDSRTHQTGYFSKIGLKQERILPNKTS